MRSGSPLHEAKRFLVVVSTQGKATQPRCHRGWTEAPPYHSLSVPASRRQDGGPPPPPPLPRRSWIAGRRRRFLKPLRKPRQDAQAGLDLRRHPTPGKEIAEIFLFWREIRMELLLVDKRESKQ